MKKPLRLDFAAKILFFLSFFFFFLFFSECERVKVKKRWDHLERQGEKAVNRMTGSREEHLAVFVEWRVATG